MELFSSFFYLLSAALFLAGFYCFPKADRAQNALVWVPVALLACECWAGFFAGLFTLVHIPVYILSIGATYLAGGLALWYFIRRRRAVQKYAFTLPGSVFFILLTLFVAAFGLVRFTPDSPITYSTSDPAVHLIFAMDTLQSGSVFTADNGMYFGSLTNALFIQMLEPVFSGLHVYKSFILKDLINLWVMGGIFYAAVERHMETRFSRWAAVVLSFVYLWGYPLSNQMYGFNYLGIFLSLACLAAICVDWLFAGELPRWFILAVLGLCLLCACVCYTFLVSVVLLGVLAALLWQARLAKAGRRQLLLSLAAVFLPCLLFLLLFIALPSGGAVGGVIVLEGAAYRNLLLDFVLFVPFALYGLVTAVKRRCWNLGIALLPLQLAHQLALFAAMYMGMISTYYYYKLNYMTWLALLLMAVLGVNWLSQRAKSFVVGGFACWALMGAFTVSGASAALYERNPLMDPYPAQAGVYRIFAWNIEMFRHRHIVGPNELALFEEVNRHYKQEGLYTDITTSAPTGFPMEYWYEALTGQRKYRTGPADAPLSGYCLVLFDSVEYREDPEPYLAMERLYENPAGFIGLRPDG